VVSVPSIAWCLPARFPACVPAPRCCSTACGDKKGDLGEAAASIRKLADNLDKRTDEISTGLVHFSNSGLKEYEAFAVEGRRTLVELHKAIRNINDHPSQLIFGR